MGGVKTGRKNYRKGKYRKRKLISNTLSPMPCSFATKLTYSSNVSINPGAAGTPAAYVYRANGLYDPDLTGGGHQPRGYDQFTPMYNHWTVVGAKVTVLSAGS